MLKWFQDVLDNYRRGQLKRVNARFKELEEQKPIWRAMGWPEFYISDVYWHNRGLLQDRRAKLAGMLKLSAERAEAI